MDSRMSKYDVTDEVKSSRVQKNENLYQNLHKSELENFNIASNTTILGESKKNEIDVDKIKKILDNKYNEPPKRKSIRLDEPDEEYSKEFDITKEYDLTAILNKARGEKESSYEEDRLKKIRDTQFDILQKLEVEKVLEDDKSDANSRLLNLINTITIHEEKNKLEKDPTKEEDTIDMFANLKGDDATETIKPIENKTISSPVVKPIDDIKQTHKLDKLVEEKNNTKQVFTSTNNFKKDEFELLDDDEKEKRNIFTEILIVLILIAFVVGMYIFFDSIINF